MMNRIVRMILLLMFLAVSAPQVQAQCAMCSLNAENSVKDGNSAGKGLNKGILFLLAMPYLAAGAVGVLWYTRYRRRKSTLYVDNSSIHLN